MWGAGITDLESSPERLQPRERGAGRGAPKAARWKGSATADFQSRTRPSLGLGPNQPPIWLWPLATVDLSVTSDLQEEAPGESAAGSVTAAVGRPALGVPFHVPWGAGQGDVRGRRRPRLPSSRPASKVSPWQ